MRTWLLLACLTIGCAAPRERARAPETTPETAADWLARGRLLELSRRFDEAEAAYRRAQELGEPMVLWRLAALLRDRGRLEEAEVCYRRCLEEPPEGEQVLWRSGRTVSIRTAVRLQLAELYAVMKRLDDAERLLDEVQREEPDRWVAEALRGDLEHARGRVAAAREHWARALRGVHEREGSETGGLEWRLRWGDQVDDLFL
jgi:tetratricopeptide (TPR) repeat protein